jgi:CelD/BcsL family acetyltransferase involved in cellulose biosynthesis
MMLPEIFQGMGHAGVFEDVARRGLLRSYVLYGANAPCALVLGYQFGDVFHYAEIAYDQTFGRFSPGTALLYLLIEDLTGHRSPRLVNFGIGDAGYKREFSNIHAEDASVLLLPKNAANAVRRRCHGAFRSLVASVKRNLEARHVKS